MLLELIAFGLCGLAIGASLYMASLICLMEARHD